MKVYLDDEALVYEGDGALGSALAAAATAAEAKGRLVVEVWADGLLAPEEDLLEPPSAAPYTGELRLVSAEPVGLVRLALSEAAALLPDTASRQREVSEQLQSGDASSALAGLGDVVRAWDVVRKSLAEGAALLCSTPESLLGGAVGADAAGAMVAGLGRTLEDIRACLEHSDTAALGDALAYELSDAATAWEAALRSVALKLEAQ